MINKSAQQATETSMISMLKLVDVSAPSKMNVSFHFIGMERDLTSALSLRNKSSFFPFSDVLPEILQERLTGLTALFTKTWFNRFPESIPMNQQVI